MHIARGRALTPLEKLLFLLPNFVRSFNHFNHDEFFNRIKQQRYENTCLWFVAHESLLWWLSRPRLSSVLWFSAGPGVGKSTMLSYLVTSLQKKARDNRTRDEQPFIIYSFANELYNNTASKVIAIAIYQLLSQFPRLHEKIFKYDQARSTSADPSIIPRAQNRPAYHLWLLLLKIIGEAQLNQVCLIVDGLDECDQKSQIDLLGMFHNAATEAVGLKILFSSRPNENLQKTFSHWSARAPGSFKSFKAEENEDYILRDIDTYIAGEVPRIGELRAMSQQEQALVMEKLTQERAAVFLPVVLLFNAIIDENWQHITDIVDEAPKDLRLLYEKLISHIPHTIKPDAEKILSFITYCRRPLSIQDIGYLRNTTEGDSLPVERAQLRRILKNPICTE
jgi:hypothetical protein